MQQNDRMVKEIIKELNERTELTSIQEILLSKLISGHIGKENSVTSNNLRYIATPREIRGIVNDLRVKGYPICSGKRGYYLAKDETELKSTMNFLKGYLDNISKAHNGLMRTYYVMGGRIK